MLAFLGINPYQYKLKTTRILKRSPISPIILSLEHLTANNLQNAHLVKLQLPSKNYNLREIWMLYVIFLYNNDKNHHVSSQLLKTMILKLWSIKHMFQIFFSIDLLEIKSQIWQKKDKIIALQTYE